MRHSRGLQWIVALAVAVAAPAAAAAQGLTEPRAAPEHWRPTQGQYSVAFSLPQGGGAGFGFWRQQWQSVAWGVELNGSFDASNISTPVSEADLTRFTVAVGPALKWYSWTRSPVSPYLRLGTTVGYSAETDGDVGRWGIDVSGTIGLGVDWFPAEGISVGGFAGARALYQTSGFDDDSQEQSRLLVNLLTSALTLHIYY